MHTGGTKKRFSLSAQWRQDSRRTASTSLLQGFRDFHKLLGGHHIPTDMRWDQLNKLWQFGETCKERNDRLTIEESTKVSLSGRILVAASALDAAADITAVAGEICDDYEESLRRLLPCALYVWTSVYAAPRCCENQRRAYFCVCLPFRSLHDESSGQIVPWALDAQVLRSLKPLVSRLLVKFRGRAVGADNLYHIMESLTAARIVHNMETCEPMQGEYRFQGESITPWALFAPL